ncbi:MAG: hypothetical protein ACP5U2_16015 [Bryobacteraceae bacterium]
MVRSDVFLKVQLDHEPWERPEELAEELCRHLRKLHGVRLAELSSYVSRSEVASESS